MNRQIFLCEDSPDGIFSGVYDAWASRLPHELVELRTSEPENRELFCEYRRLERSQEKAEKVRRTMRRTLGERGYEELCFACASAEPDRGTAVFGSISAALRQGCTLANQRNPQIRRVYELQKNVGGEYHHYLGFLRFSMLPDGVLFSVIEPRNHMLGLLAGHFGDRLSGEDFLIYDKGRGQLLCHPKRQGCTLYEDVRPDERKLGLLHEAQEDYEALFTAFCESIAVRERRNEKLQRQMLPLRFRGHMVEFHNLSEMRMPNGRIRASGTSGNVTDTSGKPQFLPDGELRK